jgi:hypothetical protein
MTLHGEHRLAQGFCLLSDADTDAPPCPAIATVSTLDQSWDGGGWALGRAAFVGGAVWCDRPYFTGNPTVDWFVGVANQGTAAGAWVQIGNEQNLPLEDFSGGPAAYFAFEDAVRAAASGPNALLAMPPSPGVPGWHEWVRDLGDHAVHAYGSFDQMRQIVQWFLNNTAGDLYVTECNFGAGNTVDVDTWASVELVPFLDWCATEERVRMVAYFAWRWDQSSSLPTSLDAAGTAVETVIRDWTPASGGSQPPMDGGVDPPPFDIDAARDGLWSIAQLCEDNGHVWLGQAVKSAVALSKGDT